MRRLLLILVAPVWTLAAGQSESSSANALPPVAHSPTSAASAAESPAVSTGNPAYSHVRAELLAIRESDQRPREKLAQLSRVHPVYNAEMRRLSEEMQESDRANLQKIEAILAKHGWLGPEDVGRDASGAIFLVIQHSDLADQKRHLPAMREAVKAGKARASSLALLEDRIELREGRPQIYGSQLRSEGGATYVDAMIDPDRVDERRASVGLPPMAEYVRMWDLVWDVEAYKQRLPERLARLARSAPPGVKKSSEPTLP